MATATAEKQQEDFKPVEKEKPKKRAKKRTKLSGHEKLLAFEMYYNSDIEINSFIEIIEDIANTFNVSYNLIWDLYNNEQWHLKVDKRDFSLAMEYERKNILKMAKFKNDVNSFVSNEFDKIMSKYIDSEDLYFKDPNELIKFLKLIKDLNDVDINTIYEKQVYKLDELDYAFETTSHKVLNQGKDYNTLKKKMKERIKKKIEKENTD